MTALRLITFNIRQDGGFDGEHCWTNRRPRVREILKLYSPDVIGLQEAFTNQIEQVAEDLPEYRWFGVGRKDGIQAGEYSPILWRTDRFELLDKGTIWLSPTPEIPGSKGWDASFERIATWIKLRDRSWQRELLIMNTHFDHVGEVARVESAKMILAHANQLAGEIPLIVIGDFNSEAAGGAYRIMSETLKDARTIARSGHIGPDATFTGFVVGPEPSQRLDYIFVGHHFDVIREATLAHHWNGVHASDHFPVLADVVLK